MVRTLSRWSLISFIVMGTGISAQSSEPEIVAFVKTYDAAFVAKDLEKLATL